MKTIIGLVLLCFSLFFVFIIMVGAGGALSEHMIRAQQESEKLEKAKTWKPKFELSQCVHTEGGIFKVSNIDKQTGKYHGTLYLQSGDGLVKMLSSVYFEDIELNFAKATCPKST